MPQIVMVYMVTMHHTQREFAEATMRRVCESSGWPLTIHDPAEETRCEECDAPMEWSEELQAHVCRRHPEPEDPDWHGVN